MHRVIAVLCLSLPLSGCFMELLGATAIQGQLQSQQLKTVKKHIDHAQNVSSEATLQQAIRTYQAEHGRYPERLQTLVPEYLAEIPTKPDGSPYGYDPATGALLEAPVSAAVITTADYRKLDALRAAIYQYGQEVTWYPATLADLVPNYLDEYPLTSDGREFVYNAQTGEVNHPDLARPAPQPIPAQRHPTPAGTQPQGGAAGQHPVSGSYSNKQMDMVEELGF